MNDGLNIKYFNWLVSILTCREVPNVFQYTSLLKQLHNTQFQFSIPMDGNRAADGINLRYRFGREKHYSDRIIGSCIDVVPCSVLEMMVALSLRVEENIMEDDTYGNRTGHWFWGMIENLGLIGMTDDHYDSGIVDHALYIFMNRLYEPNGKGGLFTVPGRDIRNTEIWYQMHYYMSSIL